MTSKYKLVNDRYTKEELDQITEAYDRDEEIDNITMEILKAKADPRYDSPLPLSALVKLAPELRQFDRPNEIAEIVARKIVDPYLTILNSEESDIDFDHSVELTRLAVAKMNAEGSMNKEGVDEWYDPDLDDQNPLLAFRNTGEKDPRTRTAAIRSVDAYGVEDGTPNDPKNSDWLGHAHETKFSKDTATLNHWWQSLRPAATAKAIAAARVKDGDNPQYGTHGSEQANFESVTTDDITKDGQAIAEVLVSVHQRGQNLTEDKTTWRAEKREVRDVYNNSVRHKGPATGVESIREELADAIASARRYETERLAGKDHKEPEKEAPVRLYGKA
jgi:hypothetical protein